MKKYNKRRKGKDKGNEQIIHNKDIISLVNIYEEYVFVILSSHYPSVRLEFERKAL